jgi:hypothetical protein
MTITRERTERLNVRENEGLNERWKMREPPRSGRVCPSKDVPEPNATIGTLYALHNFNISD